MYVQTDRSIESVNDSNKLFTNSVSATPLNTATPNATVVIMQNKPLPLTLLSLSATFSMEDISDVQQRAAGREWMRSGTRLMPAHKREENMKKEPKKDIKIKIENNDKPKTLKPKLTGK